MLYQSAVLRLSTKHLPLPQRTHRAFLRCLTCLRHIRELRKLSGTISCWIGMTILPSRSLTPLWMSSSKKAILMINYWCCLWRNLRSFCLSIKRCLTNSAQRPMSARKAFLPLKACLRLAKNTMIGRMGRICSRSTTSIITRWPVWLPLARTLLWMASWTLKAKPSARYGSLWLTPVSMVVCVLGTAMLLTVGKRVRLSAISVQLPVSFICVTMWPMRIIPPRILRPLSLHIPTLQTVMLPLFTVAAVCLP